MPGHDYFQLFCSIRANFMFYSGLHAKLLSNAPVIVQYKLQFGQQ